MTNKGSQTWKIPLRSIRDMLVLAKIRLQSRWARRNGRQRCIYFIATPVHGNLGDQAIVYAQHQMMAALGKRRNVVEITRPQYERWKERLAKYIRPTDLILIDGGGNIGTLWPEEENKMRDILRRFPENPIFIFPQTAFFAKDEAGERELRQSQKIYGAHKKLTVFCRDRATFDLFETEFRQVRHYFTPDMVPYLETAGDGRAPRHGVLLCMRDDLEKTSAESAKETVRALCREASVPVRETSTVIHKRVGAWNRARELRRKWREFSGAELVVTDRLHGMIFCAITATPCIALDNISHKVRDGYAWLRHLPYLRFCRGEDQLREAFCALRESSRPWRYDRSALDPYYYIIQEELMRALD